MVSPTFRARYLEQLANGQLPTDMAAWRLSQAEKWWNDSYRAPRVARATMNSDRYRLQHLRATLGDIKLCDLTNRHIDQYVSARLKHRDGKLPYRCYQVNRELSGVSRWAVENRALRSSVTRSLPSITTYSASVAQ